MAWYAYCIGERQAFPELARHRRPIPMESLHGVSGNQVFVYPAGDLAVVISEHSPLEALNPKSGIDHARVIADCFQRSTVLPFRFGTVFNDDESLRRSMRSNQRQFLEHIDKLRGKAEMHLKILIDDCCGRALVKQLRVEGLDREYFANLRESAGRQRERQTRARAVSHQMRRLFMPLDEQISCRLNEGGKLVLDIAHLIDSKSVERYSSKFSTTCALMRECQMQLSGPWPAYHFVHQLTRGIHMHRQQPAVVPVPAVMSSILIPEPVLVPA
ncbi:MAG: GvpL/GvpF family gas vesicle protein [Terracidiphilus sp.]